MMLPQKPPIIFFLLVLSVFLTMSLAKLDRIPSNGDWESFAIADSLIKHGVFSDDGGGTPGYNHPPGYPALIGAAGWLMPSFKDELGCYSRKQSKCPNNNISNIIISLQLSVSFLALIIIFFMTREISSSNNIAALTLLLFLFTGRLAQYAVLLQPYVIITALILISSYFLIISYKRNSIPYVILSGFSIGLAALFYPPLALASLFIAPVLFFAMRHKFARGLLFAAILLLAAGLTISPWVWRNYMNFGDISLAHNSSNFFLAARVAYNDLSFSEWVASLLFWQPGLGKNIAEAVFPAETIGRLSLSNHENSILANEAYDIFRKTYDQNNPSGQFMNIFNTYILGDGKRYAATLIPLFLRSFWGTGSLIGILGIFFLWPLVKRLRQTANMSGFILLFSSFSGCLLAQALLTPSYPFFNEHMIFIHSYAIAHVTGELELMPIVRNMHKRWPASEGKESTR
jgi:hypothetical protein